MGPGQSRFVTARTLALVRNLELAARAVTEGMLVGRHPSRRIGAGLEFSQFRSYQPGDDLRRVDWKLLARSDRLFVREAESETSVTVRLVVDATRSMLHEEGGVTKFDYARYLAAALTLLADRQGDALGLYLVRAGAADVIRPRRDARQVARVLHALEQADPAGGWPAWPVLERALAPDGPGGITVLISDLFEAGVEPAGEIATAVRHLAAARHELAVFQVLGRAESAAGYDGAVTLEDLETGRQVDLDAATARTAAPARLTALLAPLRATLAEYGAGVEPCLLDEPFEAPLRRYLAVRTRR